MSHDIYGVSHDMFWTSCDIYGESRAYMSRNFFTLIAFFTSPAAASETKQTQRLRDEGALFVASQRQLNNIEHSSLYFLSEKQQHVHVLL